MNFTLYTDVAGFYASLIEALKGADRSISMLYFEFHQGQVATEISRLLMEKQTAGVRVRLLVDEFGLLELSPLQVVRNRRLMAELKTAGVQVHLFRPRQSRTSYFNRLHFKVCAVDDQILLLGGSNIADDYLSMRDLNLRAEGALGSAIEDLFAYLVQPGEPSSGKRLAAFSPQSRLPDLSLEESRLVLTLPGHRQDVRRALLGLILDAAETIHIKTWIFLPDREIVHALLHQLESGRQVHILLSDRTRIRFIDLANQVILHRLTLAGARVWRYKRAYMHAKACWNEQGTILFGSANLDSKALNSNYECSLLFKDPAIAAQLQSAYQQDLAWSESVTPGTFRSRPRLHQGWAYLSLLAASWL